jgi:transcriptional regulator GlxA family with amidase domain
MPSYGHTAHATPATLAALRACAPRHQMMVGLDTGSWLLGAAGLLDGYKATSHWDILGSLAERFPNIDVVEDRYVIDRNRASCGGATTTLDLMLALIGRAHGATLALNVAALFMHGERDPRLDPQARLPDDRILRAAAALMRRHIEQPLALSEIAKRLHMDQRRLQRICKEKAGTTPAQLYQSIRLAEAQRWLAQSRISVAEVAYRCGYGDATAMTRAFRRAVGQSPSQYRRALAS